jgi:hypothetical protein
MIDGNEILIKIEQSTSCSHNELHTSLVSLSELSAKLLHYTSIGLGKTKSIIHGIYGNPMTHT